MQLLPILLVAAVLAADGGLRLIDRPAWLTPAVSCAIATAPVLLIVALAWVRLAWCRRNLDRGRGAMAIIAADRTARTARGLLLLNHMAALLVFDWLAAVREFTGDLILADELIAMLPALLGVLGIWWAHYPIERRVREALLVRRLDLGRPIYPMPTRSAFVLLQVRLQVLMLLVPLLMIIALSEGIGRIVPESPDAASAVTLRDGLTLAAGIGVFITAPLLARLLLTVRPLGPGPLRDDLVGICRQHRVRVRDVLQWSTSGTMINAAVMGVVGRLRYVMLTDALLDVMPRDQVLAVMAHEIGHVRRHHMPWLVATLIAAMGVTWLLQLPLLLLAPEFGNWTAGSSRVVELVLAGSQLAVALLVFGWVSRRFERQADTFAVQHLSGLESADSAPATLESDAAAADEHDSGEACVAEHAVDAMTGALDCIVRLNAMDPNRRSWRHGSVAWRQSYLRRLVGRPLRGLPIDGLIRRVKLVTILVLVMTGAAILWAEGWGPAGAAGASPPAINWTRPIP